MSTVSSRRGHARRLGLDRLGLFVPAVMSVGLLFWVVSEAVEIVRARADDARDRRARVTAAATVDELLDRPTSVAPGLRPRPVYIMIALTLLATAAYVAIGSIANFFRPAGYVGDIAWLLSLAAIVVVVTSAYGITALVVALTWPRPPAWARGVLLGSPLGTGLDAEDVGHPSWRLTAALFWTVAMAAVVSLVVAWSPDVIASLDEEIADWFARHDPLADLAFLDPLGRTSVAIGVALLGGLAALRCRVLAATITMATAVALFVSVTLRPLVARPRPEAGDLAGQLDSFPSGHIMLLVIVAGLLPVAIAVLSDRFWIIRPARLLLTVAVLASASHRVANGAHWPSDVVGGALLGLALVLGAEWAIENRRSHGRCHHCPWSADPHAGPLLGAVPIHPTAHQALRVASRLAAAAAATGLTFVTFTIDLPVETGGYTFGRDVQFTVQLGLAALVSIGALVAWRWQAAGAVLLALAATGAGIFAAVEYRPLVAVALAAALMVPAVLVWLSWQHRRLPHEIVGLALFTALLLGGTWAGATTVYDHFFGPTHPESTTTAIDGDRVDWVWAGGLQPRHAVVTAQLAGRVDTVQLELSAAADTGATLTEPTAPDDYGLVRFDLTGLQPDTAYDYRLVVDGAPDNGRGFGAFRTPVDAPFSFTVTASSCALTGSNGAVFDAIRSEDPLVHLAVGDMHYENLQSTDPAAFIDAYRRALTTPAQGALARAVPTAYVWDDHDYGPNDADASAPGRSAVREAYRRAVPHYEVPPGDAAIYQAFTIGRVRFVVTDDRSERTDDTMLGATQLDWLLGELRSSSETHAVVVWVSSLPWIGEANPGADGWAGVADERALIAEAIASAGIDNLVMVSGDAHMIAVDDGTNSDYSSTGGGGFPVFHAAALDRPGNVKGGPYSHGAYPGSGQYGVLEFLDDGGDSVTVRFVGRDWEGSTIVELEVAIDAR